jgi:hypothetical protein
VPSVSCEKQTKHELADMGIRAELYKLNVYSGPSGMFKAHIDTPRSESQIGSLVVCLPSEFEGGVLSVSHQRRNVKFDWSASSVADQGPAIRWAAFYSDCRHEVREVTAGHRITLTYNLYASRGSGLLAGTKNSLDATQLPVYQPLARLFGNPAAINDLRSQGKLAISLAHSYPYNHGRLYRTMPAALKGADMMLYEALLALNIKFDFMRVMHLAGEDEKNLYQTGFEPRRVLDEMIQAEEFREGLYGWERLGRVNWLRRPRETQLELTYLAVSLWQIFSVCNLT